MDKTYPCNVSQQGVPTYPQQYPPQQYQPQQTSFQAPPPAEYPPAGGPISYPSAQPLHMSYVAGPSQAWQQPPAEQYPLHQGPQEHMQPMQQQNMQQQSMYSTQSFPSQAVYQQQQHQHQEYNQQDSEAAAAAAGADGSRGLGSTLGGAAHKIHKVELAMHHMAHPVQGLKYHTVDKVKRKVKAKVCGLVGKVMP